jgi:hypothetical protein
MIEAKKSTEPLAALDPATSSRVTDRRFDEPVADSLVIPLAVVVRNVLANSSPLAASIVRSAIALFRMRENQALVELALRQQLAVYSARMNNGYRQGSVN